MPKNPDPVERLRARLDTAIAIRDKAEYEIINRALGDGPTPRSVIVRLARARGAVDAYDTAIGDLTGSV
jgi:hypothetical protein